jgi:hypothetical protein
MKKVILTEDQIKRMMDKLILNEQETDNENNTPDTGYKIYWLDLDKFAVKKEGDNYELYRVDGDGNGGELLHITQELSVEPTFTMQENGWPDILNSLHDSGGNSNDPSSIGSVYQPADEVKQQKIYKLSNNGDYIRDENGKPKLFPVEVQKIIDPKTEASMDYGYNHFSHYGRMQTASIPGSVTKGMGVITLGMSKGEQYVPVYGSLFLMITPDLPTNRNLQVIRSKPGAQLILNKTAIKTKDRNYMWLRFIGQMFGEGGYDWDPNEKETPGTPEGIPKPNPIVLTFEKGLNDAFNFNDVTLNDTGNQNLQSLIKYAKENYQGVSANVPVICSASIDADPNQIVKGNVKRSDYNMDLSKRRATAIANMLTTQIGIDSLKFTPQGIGETDKYDPGKKWPEIKDNNQTAGNRKLIIQLPKLQKTIQF